MGIGENIKAFRLDRGMTQEQLAKKAGISRVALGNYEREERTPNLDMLEKLAVALNTSTDIIMNLHKLSIYEMHELIIAENKHIPLTESKYLSIRDMIESYSINITKNEKDVYQHYFQRGILYVIIGRYENAIDDYNKSIELNSEFPNALIARGNLYLFLGFIENALDDFKKVEEMCSDIYTFNLSSSLDDFNKMLRNSNNKKNINPLKNIKLINDNNKISVEIPNKDFDELFSLKDEPSLSSKINLLNDDCLDLISNLVDKLIQDKNNLR